MTALLGAAALAVAIGVFAGVAPAAVADAPLDCTEVLTPETIGEIEAFGWEFLPRSDDRDPSGFVLGGGAECTWGVPQSHDFLTVAYRPITPGELLEEQTRITAEGYEVGADGVYRLSEAAAQDMPITPVGRYHHVDGLWFYADGDELAAELEQQVTAALAARAPVEAEPEPAPVTEPVLAPLEEDPQRVSTFGGSDPSVLSTLHTVSEARTTPAALAGTAALALVFAALVGLPGRLIEYAVSARYERLARSARPLLRPLRTANAAVSRGVSRLPRWLGLGLGLLAASILSALIEPGFGVNGGTVRLVLTLFAGFVIENALGLALIAWLLTRTGEQARLRFRAGSLIVIALAVVGTRLTGFQPGIVFGLILALVIASEVAERRRARLAVGEAAWILVIGLLAWGGYSLAVPLASGGSVIGVGVVETLAGLTVGCLSALPLVLLPWPGLPGHEIYRSRRGAWTVAYAVASAVFVFVVLPLPESWETVDVPLVVWTGMYLAYAVVAVLIWTVLTFVVRDDDTPERDDTSENRIEENR